jgi:hypothetical protein
MRRLHLPILLFALLSLAVLAPRAKAACPALPNSAFLCASMTASPDGVCPGGTFPMTLTFCNSDPNSNQPVGFYVWLQEAALNTGGGITAALGTPGQWLLCGSGGALAMPQAAGSWGNAPLAGGDGVTFPGAWACATRSLTLTLPAGLKFNTGYRLRVQYAQNYVNENAGQYYDYAFTSPLPNACGSQPTLLKSVEGTAANGGLMIYNFNYQFFNSTANAIEDVVPSLGGCVSVVQASPNPLDGSPASISGNTVTWSVANADASAVSPFVQSGQVWLEVALSGCACGTALNNTGGFSWAGSGGWQSSNTVSQTTCSGANATLTKAQLNASGNAVSSLADGATVQYVLQYNLSGTMLLCFDSMDKLTNGTIYSGSAAPTGWLVDPTGSWGGIDWQVMKDPATGQLYLQYQDPDTSTYKILQYDVGKCGSTGANGYCAAGNMMQVDVRIDGNASTGDVGMMLREDGSNPPNGYWVIMSIDPNPANLCLQVNVGANPGWPAACKWNAANGQGPQRGVWYTLKALEQPIGTFSLKYWQRGTPEPTGWLMTCTDGTFTCTTGANITSSTIWRPGLAGQADTMSYQDFKLYSSTALTGATVTDAVPLGIQFQSASGATSSKPAVGATSGSIVWDFSGSDNGAVSGTLYEGTGSFTWTGIASCQLASVVLNTATVASVSPLLSNTSNTTTLAVACGTSSVTPTITATSTLTLTPTLTGTTSATPSTTPTPSASPTVTVTPTQTVSPTASSSPTPRPTATPTQPALLLHLYPNSPNPFGSGGTYISFWVSRPCQITITVYDVSGESVVALPGHAVPWGDSEILWDGRNSGGKPVASGVYIYRVEARADDGEDQSDFAKCAALR